MLLHQFFSSSLDPERGYALAALTGTLQLPLYRRSRIKDLLMDRVDPTLFALSYDYVGDLSETIAHLWPNKSGLVCVDSLTLAEIVATFQGDDVEVSTRFLCDCLDVMSYEDRWALLKFLGSSMRVGLSLRSCKGVLAQYAQKPIQEIEKVWHGVSPPYDTLFAWLEGRLEGELAIQDLHFTPVMLAHPVVDADLESFTWSDWQMEWKFDGIRVQYVLDKEGCWRLFSRTGEDITHSFPDLGKLSNKAVTLDGELLVGDVSNIADFNTLQQRLGKSKPTKKLMEKYPVLLMVYDILRMDGDWLLDKPLSQRRDVLQAVVEDRVSDKLALSIRQSSDNLDEVLLAKEASKAYVHAPVLKGVMVSVHRCIQIILLLFWMERIGFL